MLVVCVSEYERQRCGVGDGDNSSGGLGVGARWLLAQGPGEACDAWHA